MDFLVQCLSVSMDQENKLNAVIEIPKHSKYKYEIVEDKLLLDRVLNQECPFNYGYIPNTLCGDDDPLDIFIISKDPIPSFTEVSFNVIGMLQCEDNGNMDDKVIAVLTGEEHLHDIDAAKWSIRNFLSTYKSGFKIESWVDKQEALGCIEFWNINSPPDNF